MNARQRGRAKPGDVVAIATMTVVFVAFFLAWRMPKEDLSAPPANPVSIADLHKNIALVGETGEPDGVLEIVLDEEPQLYDAGVVADLGRDVLFIAQGLKKFEHDVMGARVRFAARLPVSGRERYPTLERVLEMTWRRSDLLGVDAAGGVTFQDLLNESQGVGYVTPRGKSLVRAFCEDPVARTAKPFCRRELG